MKKLLGLLLSFTLVSNSFAQETDISGVPGIITNTTFDATDKWVVEDNITAFAGGGQASATQLSSTASFHRVTTVVSSSDSVKLPAAVVGANHVVANSGNATLAIYPATGEAIGTAAVNTNTLLITSQALSLFCVSAGRWLVVATPLISGTTNQINTARFAVGTLTLSTPQNIDTAATVQFNSIGLSVAASATAGTITGPATTGVQHAGTATNDSAAAGQVGEYFSPTAAANSVALTTNTTATVTSQSLTAGDWDCNGVVNLTFAATTSFTNLVGGTSTTAATLGTQDTLFDFEAPATVPTATKVMSWVVPTVRYSLSATTTVYLVTQATFTVAALGAGGTLRCRRMR